MQSKTNRDGAIEFIGLCQNFGFVPTFAKVNQDKKIRRKTIAIKFSGITKEQLPAKLGHSDALKGEINKFLNDIRNEYMLLHQSHLTLQAMTNIYKVFNEVSHGQTKVAGMSQKQVDVDKHIKNILSYWLFFFQKLVLSRGLKFALPSELSKSYRLVLIDSVLFYLMKTIEDTNSQDIF